MLKDFNIDNDFQVERIDPNFRAIFSLALPFLHTRNNVIHTYIVYQYGNELLKQEVGEPWVVLAACILHDVGWSSVPETEQLNAFGPTVRDENLRRKHETEGAVIADNILKNLKYKDNLRKRILNIIDGHDTTVGARSVDDAIVKDSDKLWRYSETGFGVDHKRFGIQPLPYLEFLSDHVEKWFLTQEGKRIASREVCLKRMRLGM